MTLAEKDKTDRRRKIMHTEEQKRLLDEYYNTLADLRYARAAFENAVDPEVISACVYEINAAQKRYSYLLARIKEEKITALKILR